MSKRTIISDRSTKTQDLSDDAALVKFIGLGNRWEESMIGGGLDKYAD